MKIVTTTGFYGSGSSAITDLLNEMDNICVKGDYEFRIFCDPDGVSDLEYNLIQNPNRHNSSNAIKRYKKQAMFLNGGKIIKRYNKFFGKDFLQITEKYIEDISEFDYNGRWYFDTFERGKYFWFFSRVYSKMRGTIDKIVKVKEREYTLLPNDEKCYAGTFSEEKFLAATVNYTDALMSKFNTENKEYVMLDQLVPPTNLSRYSRYYSNIIIFVIDRDPRDIYLLEKLYWRGKVAPVYDVKTFVKWYEWIHAQHELYELPINAIRIQFEDLVYKYDETLLRVFDFLNIDESNHIKKKMFFNPEISIKNTRLWERHLEYLDEIKYIEKNLERYCYDYNSIL